jgi:hypothetical protein
MPANAAHVWKPSDSRVVIIDSFVPVPRGGTVSTPLPLNWPAKSPRDVLDYQVDITPALVGDEGDTISAVEITIIPDSAGDLAATSLAVDGHRVVIWFAGGRSGVVYTVTLEVTTVNGRALHRSILLPVVALADVEIPFNSIEIEAGVILTDHNGNPVLATP